MCSPRLSHGLIQVLTTLTQGAVKTCELGQVCGAVPGPNVNIVACLPTNTLSQATGFGACVSDVPPVLLQLCLLFTDWVCGSVCILRRQL